MNTCSENNQFTKHPFDLGNMQTATSLFKNVAFAAKQRFLIIMFSDQVSEQVIVNSTDPLTSYLSFNHLVNIHRSIHSELFICCHAHVISRLAKLLQYFGM